MLGLLFLTAALQRVAQIVICDLMIGSRGGKDFVQNTGKSQARQNSPIHLEELNRYAAACRGAHFSLVGLEHRLGHRPSQLSGGEQQRVCIARALINSPQILLADEPTGNLDRENTKIILELLKKIHAEEQFTIVLVTHDPFVAQWGQRILTMEDGKIKCDEFLCRL